MLAKTDEGLGPCEEIACHVPERRGSSIHHSLLMLLRQRLYQIAAGYEDQNGSDPLLKAVLERLPKSPFDLASQPTISRLENAPIPKPAHRPGPRRTLRARAGQRWRPPASASFWTSTRPMTQPTASRRAPPTTERRRQCLPHLRHPLLVYHHHRHPCTRV